MGDEDMDVGDSDEESKMSPMIASSEVAISAMAKRQQSASPPKTCGVA